jgi:UDP-glucose 4-epimerase
MDNKAHILVTGGAGYIGSHTVTDLIDRGYVPVIVDDLSNAQPFIIDQIGRLTGFTPHFRQGDCCDEQFLDSVFREFPISGVIHFAAYKAVSESVKDPLSYYANNLGSLTSLLKTMAAHEVGKIVFSSSCTVYGNPEKAGGVDENTPVGKPSSPYGWTKWMCERIIADTLTANPSMSAVILRYFNPIGAHESGMIGELPQGIPNNILPYITQTVAGKLPQLTVFGNDYPTRDGSCIRDFVHVCDLAGAHSAAYDYMRSNSGLSVFNIGTGKGTSVLELIGTFEAETGEKVNWKFGPRRDGDIAEIFADAGKAEKDLHWQAGRTVADAVRDSWNWEQKRSEYETA